MANPGTDNGTTDGAANGLTRIIGANLAAGDGGVQYNFGFVAAGVSGTVFLDTNRDMMLDDGEAGLAKPPVTVTLVDANGVTHTTQTAADGTYNFPNIPPGAFTLTETPPAGFQTTSPVTIGDTQTAAGRTNENFGVITGSLSGLVYFDANANKLPDGGDTDLTGVTVTLTNSNGTPVTDANGNTVGPATTGAGGAYTFANLLAGNYVVTVTPPPGYAAEVSNPGVVANATDGTAGSPTTITAVNFPAGGVGTAYDFGVVGATVNGTVFVDRNGSGSPAGQTPLAGATVTLKDGSGATVGTPQTTGPGGTYSFPNLVPGTYTVSETTPAGYGGDPLTPDPIQVMATATTPGVANFGATVASVAGVVYYDADASKTLNAGDFDLSGATVTLSNGNGTSVTDASGNTVQPITTTGTGTYSFGNLLAGTYTVTVTQPAGYTPEVSNPGAVGGTTDGTAGSPTTITAVALPGGGAGTAYNFGAVGAPVSGTVFIDTNRDMMLDNGESGVPTTPGPVALTLTDSNGTKHTTTTNPDGTYTFPNIPPGAFTLTETPPATLLTTSPVTLTGTETAAGVTNENFGLVPATLSGFVYFDANQNFSRDVPPDANLGGATVTLTNGNGTAVTDVFGNPVGPATTTAGGAYSFANLAPGTYTVTVSQPAGYTAEVANPGTDNGTTDGAANGLTQITGAKLAAGDQGVQYNFGEQGTTLSGEVYVDNNPANGLNGVTITLTGNGQTVTTTTANGGTYSFGNLPAGNYTVTETVPTANGTPLYQPGTPVVISPAMVPTTGLPNQNFDLNTATLAGLVYHDINDNGQFDGGTDSPLNTTVTLTGTDATGTPVNKSLTTTNGAFLFTGLLPSNAAGYTLTEAQPAGYLQRSDTVGSLGGNPATQTATQDVAAGIPVAAGQNGTGYNFGEVLPTSVAGTVYFDANNNGTYDGTPTDTPLQGVTVTLSGTDDLGTPVPANTTTTTGVNGTYSFPGLRPGTYTVTETQPAGYNQGTNTVGTVGGASPGQTPANGQTGPGTDVLSGIGLPSGTAGTGYNYGEVGAPVAGTVFIDTNRDMMLDNGESGVPTTPGPVALTLTDSNGTKHTTTTNPDGTYTFPNIPPGAFTLTETPPVGLQTTTPVTLTGTQVPAGVTGENFGLVPGSLSGFVYYDANRNLSRDVPPDANLGGVTVTLTNANGSAVTDAFGAPVGPATTKPDGSYSFANLLAGTYTVTVTQPAGYTGEVANPGAVAGATDGTAVGVTVITQVGLPAGGVGTAYNFGEVGSPVTGTVFLDANRDGTQQPGDVGKAGVTVTLTGNGKTFTAPTDPSGNFAIPNVPAGTYTLTETVPPGYGSDTTTLPVSRTLVVPPAGSTGNNFGLTLSSVAGFVYRDDNNDGQFQTGTEPAIPGTTVSLTDPAGGPVTDGYGNPVGPVTTKPDGGYQFAGLLAGDYRVVETQPAAYNQGKDTAGTYNGTPTGTLPAQDVFAVPVPLGADGVNYDFGERGTFVSGTVIRDNNPAAPLGGVTVTLTGNGQTFTTTTDGNGNYSFPNLPAGNYTLTETVPAVAGTPLYAPGSPTAFPIAVPTAGLPNQNFDLNTASLAGVVYRDVNDNGVADGPDGGLQGVTVTLSGTDLLGNPVTRTAVTDPFGTYRFTGLLPANAAGYRVVKTPPAGFLDNPQSVGSVGGTAPGSTFNETDAGPLAAGQAGTGYNFGEVVPATVAGTVYVDGNDNGTPDAGEPPIGGVTVTLTGTDDHGNPVNLSTTSNPATGGFSFGGLRPSNGAGYTLTETQPAAYFPGKTTPGAVNGTPTGARGPAADPDANTLTGIVLGQGATGVSNNFGELPPAALAGTVYFDANVNGRPDNGDHPLAGVAVTLTGTDDNGTPVPPATARTDAGGNFLFPNLRPGTYTVTEAQPAGYNQGTDAAGTAGGTLPAQDVLATVVLPAGAAATGYLFGEVGTPVSGTVFEDGNTSGRPPGQPVLPGGKVTLTDPAGTVVGTAVTGPGGTYLFPNVPARHLHPHGRPPGRVRAGRPDPDDAPDHRRHDPGRPGLRGHPVGHGRGRGHHGRPPAGRDGDGRRVHGHGHEPRPDPGHERDGLGHAPPGPHPGHHRGLVPGRV